MSDFDPTTVFFILHGTMGVWLWALLGLALVLLAGIVVSVLKLYRAGRAMKRPIIAALIAGSLVTVAAIFAVPGWTLADLGALSAAADYVFAFLLAAVPGAIIAALVFMLAARYCANRDLGLSTRDQG